MMEAALIAIGVAVLIGLIAWLVQTIRLASANRALESSNRQLAGVHDEAAKAQRDLIQTQKDATEIRARLELENMALQRRLNDAEKALADNAPPGTVGRMARELLSRGTEAGSAPLAQPSPAVPPAPAAGP